MYFFELTDWTTHLLCLYVFVTCLVFIVCLFCLFHKLLRQLFNLIGVGSVLTMANQKSYTVMVGSHALWMRDQILDLGNKFNYDFMQYLKT